MKDEELHYLYEKQKEFQDKYTVRLIVDNDKIDIADAIKLWMKSKTRYKIQHSNILSIRLAYPTKCYSELCREINNSKIWFKTPF